MLTPASEAFPRDLVPIPHGARESALVKSLVERCGADGAALLLLRGGLLGASDAAASGAAASHCLAALGRRSYPLPEAPPNGGAAAVPAGSGPDGSGRLWIAALYDPHSRPTAVVAATSPRADDDFGAALVSVIETTFGPAPGAPPEGTWRGELDLLAGLGQASNLLAAAVAASGEVLHLTPSLCEAAGIGGPAVGPSVVDLTHGDELAARLRALAAGGEDPVGAFTTAFRESLDDGTVVLALRELDAARIERMLLSFSARNRLTGAERAALQDIARGLSAKESAQRLNLSPETVRARRKRIFRKVGADGCGSVMAQLLGSAPARSRTPAG